MNIKCILFDMDGVIVDSEPRVFRFYRDALTSQGIDIELDEFMGYIGKSDYMIAVEIIKKFKIAMAPEEFLQGIIGNYYTNFEDIQPMDGLIDFLDQVKSEKIKTAVVSSTNSDNVLLVLNRLELVRYFDAIICGDMVSKTKPSPEGYLKAACLLNAVPEECLVIEDSPLGIQAGINAHMTVVGYKGSIFKQDTSKATVQIHSYKELRDSYLSWKKH